MTSDKDVELYEQLMNDFDDYDCSADRYVELVASVKALRQCLREVWEVLRPDLSNAATINKITDCLEGK